MHLREQYTQYTTRFQDMDKLASQGTQAEFSRQYQALLPCILRVNKIKMRTVVQVLPRTHVNT